MTGQQVPTTNPQFKNRFVISHNQQHAGDEDDNYR